MAGETDTSADGGPGPGDEVRWPDVVLFLGDQVYADETTEEMQEFIEPRRDLDQPPGRSCKDFEEYTHLYELRVDRTDEPLAAVDRADGDDLRRPRHPRRLEHVGPVEDEMAAASWWHDRIVGGLASYWVYQHLGNLSPAERTSDEIWRQIVGPEGGEELDLSDVLDAFADGPTSIRARTAGASREIGDQPADRRRLPRGAGSGPRQAVDPRRR